MARVKAKLLNNPYFGLVAGGGVNHSMTNCGLKIHITFRVWGIGGQDPSYTLQEWGIGRVELDV